MATKQTRASTTKRTRRAANDDEFRPIDAKRAALEEAERRTRRHPAPVVDSDSRDSNALARRAPKRAATRKTAAKRASPNGTKRTSARGDASRKAPAKQRAPAKAARAGANGARGTAKKKAPGRTAKNVSETLWQLAARKRAQTATAPQWQRIEHHDHRKQTNAPDVGVARVPRPGRGDRRLSPAEKQRPSE